ncbi:MAG: aminodeoxychorismate synthase component I [Pseudomonadota bacterium]
MKRHSDLELDDCIVRPLGEKINLAALAAQSPARYPYLLQSVAHGTENARYDILFAFPGEVLTLDDPLSGADFLHALDQQHAAHAVARSDRVHPPFRGGWFVYLSYELAQQIEPTLNLARSTQALPTAFATRIPAAMVWDHAAQQLLLVAEQGSETLLDQMTQDVRQLQSSKAHDDTPITVTACTEDPAERYTAAVARIIDYIVAGDAFQVNLSRQWQAQVSGDGDIAAALYRMLCRHNPAPFAGLARYHDTAIISSSPERLVKVTNRTVETRPIAGTRPRGQDAAHDAAKRQELIQHPKERAEHIMLIDLERNDLGRICRYGSVAVNELMTLESYAHVHHIVSNVRGELREDVTPGEVIRAVFPGGTITGCPKVRCMEIIAELEGCARGPYTGSMGYLNRDGSMDLNILIRTLLLDKNTVSLRAGAGIVADSKPDWELQETRAKARGLLLALGCELQFAERRPLPQGEGGGEGTNVP